MTIHEIMPKLPGEKTERRPSVDEEPPQLVRVPVSRVAPPRLSDRPCTRQGNRRPWPGLPVLLRHPDRVVVKDPHERRLSILAHDQQEDARLHNELDFVKTTFGPHEQRVWHG